MLLGQVLFQQAQDQPAQNAANGQSNAVHRGVGGNGEHEDAAVRGTQGAAKHHRQCTGQCRADDAAGQDAQRVSRRRDEDKGERLLSE